MARALIDHQMFKGEVVTDSFSSEPVELLFMPAYTIQAQWSGEELDALISLEGSNDKQNWNTVRASPFHIEESGSRVWNVWAAGYRWVRVKVLVESGPLTISATANGKSE